MKTPFFKCIWINVDVALLNGISGTTLDLCLFIFGHKQHWYVCVSVNASTVCFPCLSWLVG